MDQKNRSDNMKNNLFLKEFGHIKSKLLKNDWIFWVSVGIFIVAIRSKMIDTRAGGY